MHEKYERKVRMNPENTSVLLIYTGGTIGMIENTETGALESFNFEQLQKHVPELQRFAFRIDTYQFDPPMDSSDMAPMPGVNWYASSATTTTGIRVSSFCMAQIRWPILHPHSASCSRD